MKSKNKARISKSETNSKIEMVNNKSKYDLEDRTLLFAIEVRALVKLIPRTISNIEDGKQLIRSSGSVAVNYIEANESLSKKDFLLRIRICRKEAKEGILWLKLLSSENKDVEEKIKRLIQEATELMMIMSSIMRKSEV